MVKKEDMPACDVATAVQVLSSKWKILILRDLLTGPKRQSELLKSLEGISQKVLTSSLNSMIEDGLVERVDFHEKPLHVEYRLTDLGDSLKPVIESMRTWGKYYKTHLA